MVTSTRSHRRRRSKTKSLFAGGPSSPHIPHHYNITQPGDHTSERYRDGVEGADESHLDERESVEVAYFSPGDEPVENDNDKLHEQRLVSIEDYPDENVSGHVVTTEIKNGDIFTLDTKQGEWEFVGVSIYNPQRLLFVPANATAERNKHFPYATYLRSDFTQKFSGINPERDVERVLPDNHDTIEDNEEAGEVEASDHEPTTTNDNEQESPCLLDVIVAFFKNLS